MSDKTNWTTTHEIMTCFVPALVYGDTTGLTDEEEAQFNDWLETQYYWVRRTAPPAPKGWQWAYGHEDIGDEDEFGRCEITDLRGATCTVTLHWRLDVVLTGEECA